MRPLLPDLLAPPLVLLAPALAFLQYQRYDLARVESLLVLGTLLVTSLAFVALLRRAEPVGRALIVALLVVFAVDAVYEFPLLAVILATVAVTLLLRTHVVAITAITFAVFNVSLLAFPERGPTAITVSEQPATPRDPSLAPWIHIVLDEHIGIDGIPRDVEGGNEVVRALRGFYRHHGFRLFGRGYSHYSGSSNSLSNMVNFTTTAQSLALVQSRGDVHRVRHNRYFQHLAGLGYRIHVYQSSWIDFCQVGDARVPFCLVYPHNAIGALAHTALNAGQRARIILAFFADQSTLYRYLREGYRQAYHRGLEHLDWAPRWDWNGNAVIPETSMQVLHRARTALEGLERGDMYFLHLLLPHNPYVYDRDCRLYGEPSRRLDIENPTASSTRPNSEQSRALRYTLYFEQIHCTLKELDELLEVLRRRGLLEASTIIIHGDHGSRITTRFPFDVHRDAITAESLRDVYSTLFAVKAPAISAGYDRCPRPLQELLAFGVSGQLEPEHECRDRVPSVYLLPGEGSMLEAHRAPLFSGQGSP